jgi:Protein of unknown function (DUF3105)
MTQRRPPKLPPQRRAHQSARKPGRSIVNQKRTPWGAILSVAAVVIVAGAVTAVVVSRSGNHQRSAGEVRPAPLTGATTIEKVANRVADTSGIDGVLAWDTTGWPGDGSIHAGALQHDHVAGPVRYAVLPPVGGPHSAVWMNAGVYTSPVPNERAIHNLEHGAVWITYNPDLPAGQIAQLTAFVAEQASISEAPASAGAKASSNRYIDLSPWASNTLPSPIVISAWGHQLRLTSTADPRLQRFVDTFRHSRVYNPEYGESVDGIPVSTGGRPSTT